MGDHLKNKTNNTKSWGLNGEPRKNIKRIEKKTTRDKLLYNSVEESGEICIKENQETYINFTEKISETI